MSSSSPFSSFSFASTRALSSACSSFLTCTMTLSMRTCSLFFLLLSYCGGTGDFSSLNLTFLFVGVFSVCAGVFGVGSGDASSSFLPSPWLSHNFWGTSSFQSISFVFQLISGLLCSNHGCPSMMSQVSSSMTSN